MAAVLLILGCVVSAAGAAMIGFGIPINEFGLGNTLINAGVTAFTGGLVLMGLAGVVSQLRHVAEALAARPTAHAAEAASLDTGRSSARGPFPPRPDRSPDLAREPATPSLSVDAIDRMRSTIPRLDRSGDPVTESDNETPLSPRAFPDPRPSSADTDREAAHAPAAPEVSTKAERPWRGQPRAEPPPRPPRERFWPVRPRAAETVAAEEEPAASEPSVTVESAPKPVVNVAPPAAEAPEAAPLPVAILKSGVVDGMAYTLYADGSIEAKLPEGTMRFASISDLRAHLETHG